MARFGSPVHAEGVLGGTPAAERCIGYLVKYLNKDISSCHEIETGSQADHLERLRQALHYEPCSTSCANGLRFGVKPQKGAKPGQRAGYCRKKDHRRETLGFRGRRVLVSRKGSGKTLGEHRRDRRTWVRDVLGVTDEADTGRYVWMVAGRHADDVAPLSRRLLLAVADRTRWRDQLARAQKAAMAKAEEQPAAA